MKGVSLKKIMFLGISLYPIQEKIYANSNHTSPFGASVAAFLIA